MKNLSVTRRPIYGQKTPGFVTLRSIVGPLVIVSGLLCTRPALAQICQPDQIQSSLQYFRRLNMDLQNRLPSFEEMESVVMATEVEPERIDTLIQSDELIYTMQRIVKDQLRGALRQGFTPGLHVLVAPYTGNYQFESPAYWLPNKSRVFRGGNGDVSCKDEPAELDGVGNISTSPGPLPNSVQEGWVIVQPYWTATSTVKVCAFDASTVTTSPTGNDCSLTSESRSDTKCGCGPNLQYCQSQNPSTGIYTSYMINLAMVAQIDRLVESIFRNNRPYSDLIIASDIKINGPLSHYLRFQTGTSGSALFSSPDQGMTIPEIPFYETDTWMPAPRDSNYRHAGVLSTMFYLLKYQSNRSRANQFYNAFLCQYFQAPPGGLPDPNDPCTQEPNLSKRCGCKYCHSALEPAAGHWGRWAERGIFPLTDQEYPAYDQSCTVEPYSKKCRNFYFLEANHPDEAPYVGKLKPYLFADTYEDNINEGPLKLAQTAVNSGQFAECTVNRLWTHFIARPPTFNEVAIIQELTQEFIDSNHDLRTLLKAIVTRPEYIEGSYCGGN